jgi:hypothetical protein
MRSALAVLLVACGSNHAAPQHVTLVAPSASETRPVEAPYAENARSAFDAAEALERAGSLNEARTAYEEIVRKWGYSLSARQARERLAHLDADSRIGDVTCRTDADCTVTMRRDCCPCCAYAPLATSKKWLAWRDGQCASERCVCNAKCAPEEKPSQRAICRENACTLAR